MTYWYEIYYEVFLGGQYFKRMHAMHQEYGRYHQRLFPDTPVDQG